VETYTFSKTFNMAGWRFGFAVGNASIIRAFKKLHTHSYSTVFGAIQDAAIAALSLPAERIAQLTARIISAGSGFCVDWPRCAGRFVPHKARSSSG
jgi:aspartate/methionine/tyrosine aminotransferase